MTDLIQEFAKILASGTPDELSKTRTLAETFVKQVRYRLLSRADLNRILFDAFEKNDRTMMSEIAAYAGDETTRKNASEYLAVRRGKPIRHLMDVDHSKTLFPVPDAVENAMIDQQS